MVLYYRSISLVGSVAKCLQRVIKKGTSTIYLEAEGKDVTKIGEQIATILF